MGDAAGTEVKISGECDPADTEVETSGEADAAGTEVETSGGSDDAGEKKRKMTKMPQNSISSQKKWQ